MTSTIAQALVHIEGSLCEGGGQLLRNAVALSALLSKPISVANVRHNRKPPGLRKQHEAGINLAATICSAETSGVVFGSTTIDFRPGPILIPQALTADTGTAGSTTLLLQVSFPCLLFSLAASSEVFSSVLTLKGGTNATQAPQIDYIQHIFLPFVHSHFGIDASLKVQRRGYFPKGGGSVVCTVPAVAGPLPCVTLTTRGRVLKIHGEARVGGLSFSLPNRIRNAATERLLASGFTPEKVRIRVEREHIDDAFGSETETGCLIGGSAVSEKGKKPEQVGEEAAKELLRNLDHGGCVDEYLQDQIIIFLALAKGRSTIRCGPLTDHTRTAIQIAQQMTGAQFYVDEDTSTATTISCDGVGFVPLASRESSRS
ncbi:RNA 3'-terminal phosphate cyclase domain-containing protein [Phlebopus sp. FC_14]|nr:RNA 3'-terminal phosphate cyclase domain-containing protein [Phlebopus sp. FC_14]